MRRLFVLSVLALGLGGRALQAQPAKKRVPPKKPSAGQHVVRPAALHTPTTTVVRKPAPARPATPAQTGPTQAEVIEAGHKAAAAAAAERVHAWLRDHGEIADDEQVPRPAPVRRPAVSAGKSTLPATAPTGTEPVKAAKGSDKKATTDDFVKAAEQRKKLEDKERPTTGVSRPHGEDDIEPESNVTPASSISTEKPAAQKAAAKAPEQPAAMPRLAAKPAAIASKAATFEEDEQEEAQLDEPVILRKPAGSKPPESGSEQPLPDAKAEARALAAKAKKEAPSEKEAKEKSSAPVLAVKRAAPVEEEPAATTVFQPKLTFRRGRLVVPAPLLGSRAILVRQNEVADQYGLERVQDDDDLIRLRRSKDLVPLPSNSAMQIDDRLEESRRYARPWAVKFLNDLGRAHQLRFHGPLQVNSAVRTVAFQQRLLRTNGNAAPAEGDTASPHLTGQAIDLAKHGLSMTEIAWLRAYLLPLVQQGKIDVEEEFQQACFHISVYKSYAPEKKKPAKGDKRLTKALAVGLP